MFHILSLINSDTNITYRISFAYSSLNQLYVVKSITVYSIKNREKQQNPERLTTKTIVQAVSEGSLRIKAKKIQKINLRNNLKGENLN